MISDWTTTSMSVNYSQLKIINKVLSKYPYAKLQIVTKNRDIITIKELIEKGYTLFGENKVQEAKEKYESLNISNLDLHLIGPLQTNKVKIALKLFNTIQTVDREKLVNEIVKNQNNFKIKTTNFFIQVNIGMEPQKSGVLPENLPKLYEFSLNKKLNIVGLMCIPPFEKDVRIYFEKMRYLRDNLDKSLKLSMGMSNDYEISLNCGSNLIRVGSRIFTWKK